jgi:hypothetical protein
VANVEIVDARIQSTDEAFRQRLADYGSFLESIGQEHVRGVIATALARRKAALSVVTFRRARAHRRTGAREDREVEVGRGPHLRRSADAGEQVTSFRHDKTRLVKKPGFHFYFEHGVLPSLLPAVPVDAERGLAAHSSSLRFDLVFRGENSGANDEVATSRSQ